MCIFDWLHSTACCRRLSPPERGLLHPCAGGSIGVTRCARCLEQVEAIVADIKESVSRVSDVHFIEADNLTVPSITYEV